MSAKYYLRSFSIPMPIVRMKNLVVCGDEVSQHTKPILHFVPIKNTGTSFRMTPSE